MRLPLVTLILTLAVSFPVLGGELIRFQATNGSIGMTDDASKLPHGATVVGRSAASAPKESQPAGAEPAALKPERAAGAQKPLASRYAPPDDNGPDAALWRQRVLAAKHRLEQAKDQLVHEEAVSQDCLYSSHKDFNGLLHNYSGHCSELEARVRRAREAVESATSYAEDGLLEECRIAGCLPGWVR